MQITTTINSTGVTIAPRDETIKGLTMYNNQKIHFLPEKLNETFPNLSTYLASACSITEISKMNFENLDKLRFLSLHSNHIEKIARNTFEDLKSLEVLYLRKKFISLIQLQMFLTSKVAYSSRLLVCPLKAV